MGRQMPKTKKKNKGADAFPRTDSHLDVVKKILQQCEDDKKMKKKTKKTGTYSSVIQTLILIAVWEP